MKSLSLQRKVGPERFKADDVEVKPSDWAETVSGREPVLLIDGPNAIGFCEPVTEYEALLSFCRGCVGPSEVMEREKLPPEKTTGVAPWVVQACSVYRTIAPAKHDSHFAQNQAAKIVEGLPFSSFAVNHMRALPHHRDSPRMNPDGGWVLMYVLRDGVEGGELVLPEYGIAFDIQGAALIGLESAWVYHGVRKPTLLRPDGFRFSLVLYALDLNRPFKRERGWKTTEVQPSRRGP